MPTLREVLGALPDTLFADLLESDDAYRLVVDAGGVDPDTVEVGLRGGRLRVTARREKAVPEGFRYRAEERALFLDFEVPLPPDVGPGVESATVERGILTITVPRRTENGGRDADAGITVPIEPDEGNADADAAADEGSGDRETTGASDADEPEGPGGTPGTGG